MRAERDEHCCVSVALRTTVSDLRGGGAREGMRGGKERGGGAREERDVLSTVCG